MSPLGFLLIVVALAFLWFALVRPQKRRQQEQATMWDSLEQGDEVVTAGGIYGEITGFRGDDVIVRIAPELEVRVARRAIAGLVVPDEENGEEAHGDVEEPEAEETVPEPAARDSDARGGSYSGESR